MRRRSLLYYYLYSCYQRRCNANANANVNANDNANDNANANKVSRKRRSYSAKRKSVVVGKRNQHHRPNTSNSRALSSSSSNHFDDSLRHVQLMSSNSCSSNNSSCSNSCSNSHHHHQQQHHRAAVVVREDGTWYMIHDTWYDLLETTTTTRTRTRKLRISTEIDDFRWRRTLALLSLPSRAKEALFSVSSCFGYSNRRLTFCSVACIYNLKTSGQRSMTIIDRIPNDAGLKCIR